ncbi:hypothetical protein [Marinoscillum furvescens]|uniref:Tetratricopeptide repeat protein n=1 Tax=Marinoscillum furvescens DSM 4134 TaxID=1122208 RepID=A0A3D9KYC0_MARFU|nr:hypothetical protein [Marinoscillum furvescens]RED94408.1 hypothetical protein C7460_12195 [Marinoscillum furvescens DSM 4134]
MKYLLSLIVCLVAFASSAQQQVPQDSIPFELRKQAYIYSMANKYNDPAVARMALYNLIATNPGSSALLDSLALLYIDYQQYASAALVAQDAMKLNPDDIFATEVAAVAFDNLGVKTRAVANYEKLYLANNDLNTLYKVAFLQLDLKRYGQALSNADIIIESSKSEEIELIFPTQDNKGQEVSMKVAAIRLKGMIEKDRGNTALAKDLFQKALDMQPDFELLKQQIAELDQ